MSTELDEKGWIFLGNDGIPYWVRMWGEDPRPWLFKWYKALKRFVSLHEVGQQEVWGMPDNLTTEEQDLYRAAYEGAS